jgi:3-oxoisoapionate decarboxylase
VTTLGIGQHSYTEAWKGTPGAQFRNALTFLEYAHSIEAAGVQVAIKPDEQANAASIRERAEKLGVYFEGNLSLPKSDAELDAFEAHIKAIKAAGGDIARTACLSGRRYETFKTRAEFVAFKETSWNGLVRAEPILKKHKVRLAVENHKDWLVPEQIGMLNKLSSEWVGALIDTGNSIALLEDTYEVIEGLAPFAFSSHLKDMAVRECEDGFLLSEVPLGEGFLDIPKIVSLLRKANPQIRLNLEMITRDPLKVPCLSERYYATFENLKASRLAGTIASVKSKSARTLPKTTGLTAEQRGAYEDENVRQSIRWAATHLTS